MVAVDRLSARARAGRHFFHHNHDNLVVFHAPFLSLSLSLSLFADIIRIPDRNFHLLSPSLLPPSLPFSLLLLPSFSLLCKCGSNQFALRSVGHKKGAAPLLAVK